MGLLLPGSLSVGRAHIGLAQRKQRYAIFGRRAANWRPHLGAILSVNAMALLIPVAALLFITIDTSKPPTC